MIISFTFILEHFMVWIQFSTTAYWYKLWGRISENLPKGTYYLKINNSTFVKLTT